MPPRVASRRGTEVGGGWWPSWPALVERPDLSDHPRVRFARAIRDDLHVLGYRDVDRDAVAVICRGIGGLTELSFEPAPRRRRDCPRPRRPGRDTPGPAGRRGRRAG